jgi:hypothetical protein
VVRYGDFDGLDACSDALGVKNKGREGLSTGGYGLPLMTSAVKLEAHEWRPREEEDTC